MKTTIFKLITIMLLLTAGITTFAQSPLPSANYTTLYKSGRAAAIVGATQTLVNSGKTVATYNFTDETTVEGTSYWFQLETEVPSGTTTLFSIGIQTTKRGL